MLAIGPVDRLVFAHGQARGGAVPVPGVSVSGGARIAVHVDAIAQGKAVREYQVLRSLEPLFSRGKEPS